MQKVQQKETTVPPQVQKESQEFQRILYNKPLLALHFIELSKVDYEIGLHMTQEVFELLERNQTWSLKKKKIEDQMSKDMKKYIIRSGYSDYFNLVKQEIPYLKKNQNEDSDKENNKENDKSGANSEIVEQLSQNKVDAKVELDLKENPGSQNLEKIEISKLENFENGSKSQNQKDQSSENDSSDEITLNKSFLEDKNSKNSDQQSKQQSKYSLNKSFLENEKSIDRDSANENESQKRLLNKSFLENEKGSYEDSEDENKVRKRSLNKSFLENNKSFETDSDDDSDHNNKDLNKSFLEDNKKDQIENVNKIEIKENLSNEHILINNDQNHGNDDIDSDNIILQKVSSDNNENDEDIKSEDSQDQVGVCESYYIKRFQENTKGIFVKEGMNNKLICYFGQHKNKIPDGKGILFMGKEGIYEGYFLNGNYYGPGRMWKRFKGRRNSNRTYCGIWEDGEKMRGISYKSNGKIKMFEGNFENYLLEGKGIEFRSSGCKFYEGIFKNGIWNGEGTVFKNNIPIEKGTFYRKSLNGKGIQYCDQYSRRIKFEGTFKYGCLNGEGKSYNWVGKLRYSGGFQKSTDETHYLNYALRYGQDNWFRNMTKTQYHGQGTLFHSNGEKQYEGMFDKDQFHGKGTKFFDNGQIQFEGIFEKGQYHSEGIEFYENGQIRYQGLFQNGQPEGEGIIYHNNGLKAEEGCFGKGGLKGKGICYNQNGQQISEGEFQKGMLHGPGIKYYPNGQKHFVGFFTYDSLKGQGTEFYLSGQKCYEGEFDRIGSYTSPTNWHGKGIQFYESGQKQYKGMFRKGKRCGEGVEYFENGKIHYRGHFKDDNYHGQGTLYNSEGQKVSQGRFLAGYLIGDFLKQYELRNQFNGQQGANNNNHMGNQRPLQHPFQNNYGQIMNHHFGQPVNAYAHQFHQPNQLQQQRFQAPFRQLQQPQLQQHQMNFHQHVHDPQFDQSDSSGNDEPILAIQPNRDNLQDSQ